MLHPFSKKNDKHDYITSIIPHLRGMDVIGTNSIRLWNPLTWSGFITTRLTESLYSHVFLASKEQGKGLSTGASGFPSFKYGEVDLVKYLMNEERFIIRRVPGLVDIQIDQGMKACQAMFGEKYPVAEPLIMVVQNLMEPGMTKLAWNTHARICSDGVSWVYAEMKHPLNGHIPLDFSMRTPYTCLSDPQQVTKAVWPLNDPSIGEKDLIPV